MSATMLVAESTISLAELREHAGHDLFVVLDACDEPRVLALVDQLGSRAHCLYSGKAGVTYRGIAPYLIDVDDALITWIVAELQGAPWGIFILSTAPLLELRRHLRRFLHVKLPDDSTVYFRFYDPRVLAPFLHSCNAAEISTFYGPVDSFVIENETPAAFTAFAKARQTDRPSRVSLHETR